MVAILVGGRVSSPPSVAGHLEYRIMSASVVKRGSKLLSLSTSSMMLWTMDIDVVYLSRHRIKLVLLEQSITYDRPRRERFQWKIQYPPYDIVSQVGMALLSDERDWGIEGTGRIKAEPASEVDEDYLALCWHRSEYTVVGELLSDVGPIERAAIHQAFGGFQDPELLSCCRVLWAWMRRRGATWSDLVARSPSSPEVTGSRSWWRNTASAFRAELEEEDARRERERALAFAKKYGEASLFSDLASLVEKRGREIPPGYLLHMTLFPPPASGPVSDVLAMAWGRQGRPLPAGEGEVTARFFNVSMGDGDFAFAAWLFRTDKRIKMERLLALADADAEDALNKLVEIAAIGRRQLSRLRPGSASGLALSIGRYLAKTRASLDPYY